MASIKTRVKVTGLARNINAIKKIVDEETMKSMKNCMKDLERVTSETTPLDEGDLEMGGDSGVNEISDGVEGWVRFEVWNDHPRRSYDFNYAIWIHEENYNLGKRSLQKAGGKGLSGKSYSVGKKYLTRPHEGEAPTYRKIIADDLKKALRSN